MILRRPGGCANASAVGGLLVPVPAENEQDEAPPTTERTERASPTQRGRKSEQSLTLDMLKEVLAQERGKDREHLAQPSGRQGGYSRA